MSEKTEHPSPKRLRDARRKGDLARSRMLAAAGALLGGAAGASASFADPEDALRGYLRSALLEAGAEFSPAAAVARATEVLARAGLPVGAGALFGALLFSAFQVGVLVRPDALRFRVGKLNPSLRNLVSRARLVDVFRCLLLTSAAAAIAWSGLRRAAPTLVALPASQPGLAFAVVKQHLSSALLGMLALGLVLGALDLLYERWAHLRRLRMSRDELKREHRDAEGDPHYKARRRGLHKALLAGTSARGVRAATVVVVNPTHVAVALRYVPGEAEAPTIVAKGIGEHARRIRVAAERMRVPIVRDVPLARALIPFDLGDEIPEELYEAAAAVLRKVYELGGTEAAPEERSAA